METEEVSLVLSNGGARGLEYVDGGVINPLPINRLKNKKKLLQ